MACRGRSRPPRPDADLGYDNQPKFEVVSGHQCFRWQPARAQVTVLCCRILEFVYHEVRCDGADGDYKTHLNEGVENDWLP